MRIARITKVSDDRFGGNHPNGINEGYVTQGIVKGKPVIGERYYVGVGFSTSIVTNIISKTMFKTLYSTYRIEYINKPKKK